MNNYIDIVDAVGGWDIGDVMPIIDVNSEILAQRGRSGIVIMMLLQKKLSLVPPNVRIRSACGWVETLCYMVGCYV